MRASRVGRVVVVCWTLAMAPSSGAAEDRAPHQFEGDVRVEGFYTTDLFPGGDALEPDWGTRFTLEPRWIARLGPKWRLRPWVRSVIERYRDRSDRDLERWMAGLDLKRGPHRLRLYGGWSRNELYFPSPIGDARLNRVIGGGELRVGFGAAWLADLTAEWEDEDFVPLYDERDDRRWTWRTSLQRGFGEAGRLRLVHIYRRSDSVSHLYTYEQNALRAEAAWRDDLGWDISVQGEAGLRNYRTGRGFASNFGREDERWRVRAGIGHMIASDLSAQAFGEWQRNESTRLTKNYDVRTAGLAVSFSK